MAHSRKPAIKNGRPKRGQYSKKARLKAMPIYAAFGIVLVDDTIGIKLYAVGKDEDQVSAKMITKAMAEGKTPSSYVHFVVNINLEPIRISKTIVAKLKTTNTFKFTEEQITGIHMTIMQQLTVLMSQILSNA